MSLWNAPHLRARRSEYWWFVLANAIVSNVLYALALLLPSLAVMVRRLHHTGRSGWYYWMALIPFAGIFIVLNYMIQEGNNGANAYGPDPKA